MRNREGHFEQPEPQGPNRKLSRKEIATLVATLGVIAGGEFFRQCQKSTSTEPITQEAIEETMPADSMIKMPKVTQERISKNHSSQEGKHEAPAESDFNENIDEIYGTLEKFVEKMPDYTQSHLNFTNTDPQIYINVIKDKEKIVLLSEIDDTLNSIKYSCDVIWKSGEFSEADFRVDPYTKKDGVRYTEGSEWFLRSTEADSAYSGLSSHLSGTVRDAVNYYRDHPEEFSDKDPRIQE